MFLMMRTTMTAVMSVFLIALATTPASSAFVAPDACEAAGEMLDTLTDASLQCREVNVPEVPEIRDIDIGSLGCGGTLVYACAGWDASCHSWAGGNCAATAKGFHGGLVGGVGSLTGSDPGIACLWVGTGCTTNGNGIAVGPDFGCGTAIATSNSLLGISAVDQSTFCGL